MYWPLIMGGFLGMAIIGGIGVSLGFSPAEGGFVGFCLGAIFGFLNPHSFDD